jgi:hypothetical protein
MSAPQRTPFARWATQHILADLSRRVQYVLSLTWLSFSIVVQVLPRVRATQTFQPHATNDTTVASDASYIMGSFQYSQWWANASAIRNQATNAFCFGNLSLFLENIGPVYQADLNGSAGALTILPTAGALIGAPAQELWILFRLMPLAGVLSMLLSLGGNIIPTEAREYSANSKFSYGGFIATANADSGDEAGDERLPGE